MSVEITVHDPKQSVEVIVHEDANSTTTLQINGENIPPPPPQTIVKSSSQTIPQNLGQTTTTTTTTSTPLQQPSTLGKTPSHYIVVPQAPRHLTTSPSPRPRNLGHTTSHANVGKPTSPKVSRTITTSALPPISETPPTTSPTKAHRNVSIQELPRTSPKV